MNLPDKKDHLHQSKLLEAKSIFGEIMKADIGFWDYDLLNNREYLSPSLLNMLGYEFSPDLNRKDIVHEEDFEILSDAIEHHIESRTKDTCETIIRCRLKNGGLTHVLCKGKISEWSETGEPLRLTGFHIDISLALASSNSLTNASNRLELIMEGINAGIWEWDLKTKAEWWSAKFYQLLGYEQEEILPANRNFIETLLHKEDRPSVEGGIQKHLEEGSPFKMDIRLLSKDGYKWFEISGHAEIKKGGEPIRMTGAIIDIHEKKEFQIRIERNEYLLAETGKMARMGGWEIDLKTLKPSWSKEVYEIHEISPNTFINLKSILDFYVPEHQPILKKRFEKSIKTGRPFDLELELITGRKRRIWVRAMGTPTLAEDGTVIGIRGVFQDIDEIKKKELFLLKSVDVISEQNKRLLNFAHIVSHNLRSHSGNFELLLQMFNKAKTDQERDKYMEMIKTISSRLTETISYLNEVIAIQNNINQAKAPLEFENILQQVVDIIQPDIERRNGTIKSDFSAVSTIEYVPSYLESILLNLLTNALKYQHPDRDPVVEVKTIKKMYNTVLEVRDNGLGIDLKRHQSKMFGMFKTFHRNPDAKGIGLFITKNQVESLGGKITVESEEGKGSVFRIIF